MSTRGSVVTNRGVLHDLAFFSAIFGMTGDIMLALAGTGQHDKELPD